MDLANFSMKKEGVWFTPFFDGTKIEGSFQLVGKNSEQYRRVEHRYAKIYASGNKNSLKEQFDSIAVDTMVSCCLDWKNLKMNGEDFPCTAENKKALFSNPDYLWLTDQIYAFILDNSNFFSVEQPVEK